MSEGLCSGKIPRPREQRGVSLSLSSGEDRSCERGGGCPPETAPLIPSVLLCAQRSAVPQAGRHDGAPDRLRPRTGRGAPSHERKPQSSHQEKASSWQQMHNTLGTFLGLSSHQSFQLGKASQAVCSGSRGHIPSLPQGRACCLPAACLPSKDSRPGLLSAQAAWLVQSPAGTHGLPRHTQAHPARLES